MVDLSAYPQHMRHPFLDTASPALLEVYSGEATLVVDGSRSVRAAGTAKIEYDGRIDFWPRIEWHGVTDTTFHQFCLDRTATDELAFLLDDGSRLQAAPDGPALLNFEGAPSRVSRILTGGLMGDFTRAKLIKCLVYNLARINGDPIADDKLTWRGRTAFRLDTWEIILDECTRSVADDKDGPSAIVLATPLNQQQVDEGAVRQLVDELRALFTTIHGAQSAVYAAVGLSDDSKPVAWLPTGGLKLTQKTLGSVGWPNRSQFDLNELSRVFHECWRSDLRLLETALNWRAKAYRWPAEPGEQIVNGCVSLESLAYGELVDRSVIGADSFRKMSTGDAVSLCLRFRGVDVQVPMEFEALARHAKAGGKDSTGPSAVFQIRNSVVHPGKKEGGRGRMPDFQAIRQAARLLQWYTDVLLFGFVGIDSYLQNPFSSPTEVQGE